METTAREQIHKLINKPGDDIDFRTDLLNWVEKNYNPDSVFKDQLVKQSLKVFESEAIVNLKHAYEQAEARKIELQRLVERYRKELGYSL